MRPEDYRGYNFEMNNIMFREHISEIAKKNQTFSPHFFDNQRPAILSCTEIIASNLIIIRIKYLYKSS